ncbi:MAG: ribonuclease Z [Zestosphaera sp.]
MNPIIITFLGSRGPYPGSDELPSILVSYGGRNILLDIGEGTQHRLLEVGKSVASVDAVLITHMHGDHVLGLIPFLQSRSLAGITSPLLLIGPRGLGEYLRDSFSHLYFDAGYELVVVEIIESTDCDWRDVVEPLKEASRTSAEGVKLLRIPCDKVIVKNPFKMRSFWVKHSIPTLSYRLDLAESASICYASDVTSSEEVVKACRGVRVLIHDATFGSELSDKAREYMHSTALQAAETALECGAEVLMLYHMSPRYKELEELLSEARKVFRNSYIAEKFMKLYLAPSR